MAVIFLPDVLLLDLASILGTAICLGRRTLLHKLWPYPNSSNFGSTTRVRKHRLALSSPVHCNWRTSFFFFFLPFSFWNMLVYTRPRHVNRAIENIRTSIARTRHTKGWSWLTPSTRKEQSNDQSSCDAKRPFESSLQDHQNTSSTQEKADNNFHHDLENHEEAKQEE